MRAKTTLISSLAVPHIRASFGTKRVKIPQNTYVTPFSSTVLVSLVELRHMEGIHTVRDWFSHITDVYKYMELPGKVVVWFESPVQFKGQTCSGFICDQNLLVFSSEELPHVDFKFSYPTIKFERCTT